MLDDLGTTASNDTPVLQLNNFIDLATPFNHRVARVFDGRRNIHCVPLTGADERPGVRSTFELKKALPNYVVDVAVAERTHELDGQVKSGDLLEILEDVNQLRPLGSVDPHNQDQMGKLIDTLVHVAHQLVQASGPGFVGFSPEQFLLRSGSQVVFLPGLCNRSQWPAKVTPFIPDDAPKAVAKDTYERLLCGNISRLLFFFTHGVSQPERNLARVRNRKLRARWQQILAQSDLDSLYPLLRETFVESKIGDTSLRPETRPQARSTGNWSLVLLLLGCLAGIGYWQRDVLASLVDRVGAALSGNTDGLSPSSPAAFAEQSFLILDATGEDSDNVNDPPGLTVFKPKPSEANIIRDRLAGLAGVNPAKVTYDPETGRWTVRDSGRYLQPILEELTSGDLGLVQIDSDRDLKLSQPRATTIGSVEVRRRGVGQVVPGGELLVVFEVQNPPDEPNRYQTLTFIHGAEEYVLDLSENGNQVSFEPLFGEPYDLRGERVDGGVDVFRGVVLCTQDEQQMRSALKLLFKNVGINVPDSELSAFYLAKPGSDRFFLIKPQRLLRSFGNGRAN